MSEIPQCTDAAEMAAALLPAPGEAGDGYVVVSRHLLYEVAHIARLHAVEHGYTQEDKGCVTGGWRTICDALDLAEGEPCDAGLSSAPGEREAGEGERERLEALYARITEKVPLLESAATLEFGNEGARLRGKASGVALAASFVDEAIRALPPRCAAPSAPEGGPS